MGLGENLDMRVWDKLRSLYEARIEAYHEYRKVADGNDLVPNQRVSPTRVEQAHDEWMQHETAYTDAAQDYADTWGIPLVEVTMRVARREEDQHEPGEASG